MFFPAKMCKVRLIGPKSVMRRIIEALESYGGAEIKKVSGIGMEASKPLEEHSSNIEKLLRLEALAGALGQKDVQKLYGAKEARDYVKTRDYMEAEKGISEVSGEMDRINSEMEILKDKKGLLAPFTGIGIDFGKLRVSSVTIYAGTVQGQKKPRVEEALRKATDAKWFFRKINENLFMCIVAAKAGDERIAEEAAKAGLDRAQLPEMSGKPAEEIGRIGARIAELEKKRASLKKKIGSIAEEHYGKISAAKEYFEIETGKSSAASLFGATQHSFILEAYIPENNFAEFESFIEKSFPQKVELRKFSSMELEHMHEETPTLMEHGKALFPFEWINKYMSVPKSNEVDPTLVFLVFFPLFYGMMVGDFVYGILSFLIARFIVKKVSEENILKPVGIIWMWSAIPTIIFGLIYDEFAGMPHAELIHKFTGIEGIVLYHGIERLHNVQFLLAATILLGVLVVCAGFLLGFINATRHGNRKHAMAKMGWFGVVVFGTVLISGAMFSAFPPLWVNASIAMLLASFIAVLKAEGPTGLIELPSVVGNVMSFSRILAVGLVGTLIALILNDLMFPSLDRGLLIIILLPIYIAGHLFNAGLAMFESFIQGARLNFVEMYSKFYEGGGREFSPFKLKRKYLKY